VRVLRVLLVPLYPATLILLLRVHVSMVNVSGDVDREGGCVSSG
jgi:hypothetical protein